MLAGAADKDVGSSHESGGGTGPFGANSLLYQNGKKVGAYFQSQGRSFFQNGIFAGVAVQLPTERFEKLIRSGRCNPLKCDDSPPKSSRITPLNIAYPTYISCIFFFAHPQS
jgi:hypothetical protein